MILENTYVVVEVGALFLLRALSAELRSRPIFKPTSGSVSVGDLSEIFSKQNRTGADPSPGRAAGACSCREAARASHASLMRLQEAAPDMPSVGEPLR